MPGQDKTGPLGFGPQAGCRRGFCNTAPEDAKSNVEGFAARLNHCGRRRGMRQNGGRGRGQGGYEHCGARRGAV